MEDLPHERKMFGLLTKCECEDGYTIDRAAFEHAPSELIMEAWGQGLIDCIVAGETITYWATPAGTEKRCEYASIYASIFE